MELVPTTFKLCLMNLYLHNIGDIYGNVPVAQCVRNLIQKGYDGVLSIEFEGMEDVLTGIAIGQENLRRFVAMAKA